MRCAAVDLGAGSGRVIVGERRADRLVIDEVHRFASPMVAGPAAGSWTWDVDLIEAEIRKGLAAAEAAGPIDGFGIDGWAVDHVLLDADFRRLGPVWAYRDHRTDGERERVFAEVSRAEIWRRTGIQFLPFNTLYQLTALARLQPDLLARARHFLMVPDYLIFRLSGFLANEYTNATTTQFYGLHGDDWDRGLLAALGLGRLPLAGRPVEPGTILGTIPSSADPARSVAVIAVASHDTASAVVAAPLSSPDDLFVSSGTWSLMGFESPKAFTSPKALRLGVSNEGGWGRRFRVLKNIAGMWPIQRIRDEAGNPSWERLIAAAEAAEPWRSLVDLDDERFLSPPSMTAAVEAACAETGEPRPEGLGALARCVFESLALSYAEVKRALEDLRGRPFARLRIVGGGSRNRFLDQLAADACDLPVSAGPVETSALGNVCVQMIALGALRDVDEARTLVRRSFAVEDFEPRGSVPDPVRRRFRSVGRRHPQETQP
ncbi:rhamnulokinase [Siculibacillus lacustris]|nr:rhamnulokinase family protein [Siculibacillus lacustris]